jgi:uncharacterized protein (DUF1015 family)
MASIGPFSGTRYDVDRAGNLADLVAPPWDVISEEDRARLLSGSRYNVVNLTLPEASDGSDRFESCSRLLREWLDEGVLAGDERPGMYLYRHEFEWEERRYERTGIIASLELRDGDVKGHERTRPKSMDDRLRLLSVTRCVFGPIFMLCPDPDGEFRELLAGAECGEASRIELNCEGHSFSVIDDPDFHDRVRRILEPETLVIADGHHRYGASVENLRLASKGGGDCGWARRTMVYCVSVKDPGLFVLPSHRMVKGIERPAAFCLEELGKVARVEPAGGTDDLRNRMRQGNGVRIGLVLGRESGVHLLTMDREENGPEYDVEYLHERLLPAMGGDAEGVEIDFTQSAEKAVGRVSSGERDMCFLLRGVAPQDVVDTAVRGHFMPSKSTYFYPKPLTGLVLMRNE